MEDIKPLDKTLASFEQKHLESLCDNLEKRVSSEYGSGSSIIVSVECVSCDLEYVENYILDYSESGDKRWSRNQIPECGCNSHKITEDSVVEDKGRVILVSSSCDVCGMRFKDHYSYVD